MKAIITPTTARFFKHPRLKEETYSIPPPNWKHYSNDFLVFFYPSFPVVLKGLERDLLRFLSKVTNYRTYIDLKILLDNTLLHFKYIAIIKKCLVSNPPSVEALAKSDEDNTITVGYRNEYRLDCNYVEKKATLDKMGGIYESIGVAEDVLNYLKYLRDDQNLTFKLALDAVVDHGVLGVEYLNIKLPDLGEPVEKSMTAREYFEWSAQH